MICTLRLRAATALAAVLATVAALLLLVPASPAGAAPTLPAGFTQDVIATGLDLPTAMAVLPDGRILVTEKSGVIRVIKDGVLLPTPFADLRAQVNDYWDRGLTGIAAAPDFATTRQIFLFYPHDSTGNDGSGPVTNRLTRVTANGDVVQPGSETVILGSITGAGCPTTSPDCIPQDWYGHSADSLRFAPDGSLFVTMGDAASWDYVDDRALRAQDIDQYPGKVLRITRDGDGLASNPFWNGNPDAIRSKVWAYGLRNPFRTSLQPGTNQLFVGDVGWSTTEELDVATAGANFGWPCYEGDARQPGYEPKPACQALYAQGPGAVKAPAYTYDNGAGASIVGGPFTPDSSPFPADFHGGLFFGDYAKSTISFAKVSAAGTITEGPYDFASSLDGPVDIQFDVDGNLLYLAINAGELRRIRPGGGTGPTGPNEYLSDLAPALSTNGWGPIERDRSNGEQAADDGRPLSIGGTTYEKGLGTHAASEIRYTVPAGCLFTAQVGIDDEVGDRGSVQFEVWDGTNARLYQSPVKRGADGPTAVAVPLNAVTNLRLVVVGTDDGIQFDHADWADARIECDPDVEGAPPTPVIEAPASNSTFAVGETIQLRGSATDAEDGTLPGSALSWRVIIQHCGVTGGDCHVHTLTTATGATASFVAPDHSDESYIEVVLVATDTDGNVTTISKNVQPRTVPLSFSTSPAGLQVLYGDRPITTPATVNALVGGTRTITAPTPQGSSSFQSWSDGGARQHEITVPSTARSYTATFSGGSGGTGTTYLSDLTPSSAPVNGWGPYERDRSNGEQAAGDGRTLTIGGKTYAKGLGVHAASDLRYTVPAQCTFSAEVGIDDEVGNFGTVQFEVWNGTTARLHQTAVKTGAEGATAITVPLGAVTDLRLVAATTSDGTKSDHADWADAKITCGSTSDTTAPAISAVAAAPTSTGATISWTTDEASTTQVEYGTTAAYGSSTTLAPAMVTAHSQALTGLLPGTTYHYRVRSADAAGNVAVSTDRTFTTSASGGTSTTFLSDLTPVGSPVNAWGPYERDRSNGEQPAGDGRTLTIGGKTYTKGLGVHAASELRYTVPAQCTFEAEVGIDDEVGNFGSVQFEVWNGTTTRLYQSPVKRGADGPTVVSVPLGAVTDLRLVAAPTGDGQSSDHADWADAKVTCGSGGGGSDTTAPAITAVSAAPTSSGATITWTTNEPSSSRVEYGPTASFGSSTPLDGAMVTSHSVTLTGLTAGTTYHYRVRSADAAGNAASSPAATFTTTTGPGGGTGTTFLSDLTPIGTPTNGWGPYERDRANGEDQLGDGPPLTINGTVYPKGLGTHAAAELRYAVPSGCSTFSAQVGVDDAVSTRGTVVFEVWNGTATRLYQSPLKTGADGPTAVSVPLSGVTTLRLVVSPTGDGRSSDHADWGDAKFTCGGSTPGDTTAPTITAVTATPSATGATIAWTTDEASDTRIEYGTTASYGSSTPLAPAMVTAHSQALSGLTPSTTYHYRVRSADAAGNVALSTDRTFTTTAASTGGTATFAAPTTVATGTNAHSVSAADLDGDGDQDVVVANAGSDTVTVLFGNGTGGLTLHSNVSVGDEPKAVAIGDIDGDGDRDLVSANQATNDISVIRNAGNNVLGPFGSPTVTSYAVCRGAHEPALGDLNGDGRLDVAVACWGGSVITVRLGNGDGTFGPARDFAAGSSPHSIVILETNADGRPDLAVANNGSANVSILRGNGDGTFQAPTNLATGGGPHSIRNADLNGDGKLDIGAATINGNYPTLVNPGGNVVSILLGNGDGTFKPKTDIGVGQGPFAVGFVRLDGDAKPDLVAANWWDGGITIRRNTSP